MIIVFEMHKIDWFKPIIIEPKIGVAKIYFFEKYERSVVFCVIPISMKSANTTYKVWSKSSETSCIANGWKYSIIFKTLSLALWDVLIMNSAIHIKENNEHDFDLWLHLARFL